jgi:flagellar motor switch protein FliN
MSKEDELIEDGETQVNLAAEEDPEDEVDDGLDLLDDADDDASADDEEYDLGLGDAVEAPAAAADGAAASSAETEQLGSRALGLTADVPVQVVAVLGKKTITMKDLFQMELGQVIDMGVPLSTTVDLVANGKLIAKGELVEIDGKFGVKIIHMVK